MSPIDLNVDFDLIRHDFLKGFVCTKLHRAKYDEHVEYMQYSMSYLEENNVKMIMFCVVRTYCF